MAPIEEEILNLYKDVLAVLVRAGFNGEYCQEPNDPFTRKHVVWWVSNTLNPYNHHFGYHVVCDETNNPPSVVDAGELVFHVGFPSCYYAVYRYNSVKGLRLDGYEGEMITMTGVLEN